MVRKTWADRLLFPTLFTVFPVGFSLNQAVNKQIREESDKYGDILQGDFIESYNNLVFKTLMSWQWMLKRCDLSRKTGIKTILKADDDVMINTPFLISKRLQVKSKQLLCREIPNTPIIRDTSAKDFMSFIDFPWPREFYQTYCFGGWMLMHPDLVEPMYKVSELNYGFRHDDVYVGMIGSCVPSLKYVDRRSWQCESFTGYENDLSKYLAIIYLNSRDQFMKAWEILEEK
jgi:hypothetical protein